MDSSRFALKSRRTNIKHVFFGFTRAQEIRFRRIPSSARKRNALHHLGRRTAASGKRSKHDGKGLHEQQPDQHEFITVRDRVVAIGRFVIFH